MAEIPLSELLSPETLSSINDYLLLAKTAVEGLLSGLHRSHSKGSGSEFLQYRDYVPGDELKYLDWKLLAKHNKACCKVFYEESNLDCVILLDASASMAYQGNNAVCSKFRYAAIIAACIAYLAKKQGDRIGLCVYADQIKNIISPTNENANLARLLVTLENIKAEGVANQNAALQFVEEYLQKKSLIVWLSDFQGLEENLAKNLRQLRFAGHDNFLCQILDEDELKLPFNETLRFVDSENNREITTNAALIREEYKERMNNFLDSIRKSSLNEESDFLLASSSDNIGNLLAAWLHKRERLS